MDALAHLLPFGDAPARRAIAVGGIVRAGLVRECIWPDAAFEHLRKDLGGVAEQPDAGRLGRRANDLQRLVDARRAAIDVARLEALLDAALLHLDRDAMRTRHHCGERLRPAHPTEPCGQDPFALEIAAIMLAAHLGEGLVC